MFNRIYPLLPAQKFVAGFLGSFKEFPARNKPASFSVGDALKKMATPVHN